MKPADYKAMVDTIKEGKGSERSKRLAIGAVSLLAIISGAIGIYVLGAFFVAFFL